MTMVSREKTNNKETFKNPAISKTYYKINKVYLYIYILFSRVTVVLGYLPQEMIGTSLYEYVTEQELSDLARTHRGALVKPGPLLTRPYSFKTKDGNRVVLQSIFKPFKNPWTKDVECLVANNLLIRSAQNIMNHIPAMYNVCNDGKFNITFNNNSKTKFISG